MLIFSLLKIDSGCQKSCEPRIWKTGVYLIGMSLWSLCLCHGSCSQRSFCSWEWHGYWDAAAQNHVTRFWHVFARRRHEAKMRDSDRKTRNNSQEMLVLGRVEYLCSSAKGIIIFSWLHLRYCRSRNFLSLVFAKKSNIFVELKILEWTICWFSCTHENCRRKVLKLDSHPMLSTFL